VCSVRVYAFVLLLLLRPLTSTLFPYTTLFRSNIPDDGGLPVYIGCLDTLLEPFVRDEAEAEKAIRFLLVHVDRTISNAFCHADRSEEHTSELQSRFDLVCRLLLEKKNIHHRQY